MEDTAQGFELGRGSMYKPMVLDLLSAPLMIPLLYCQIKSFQRATRWGEAMARRRKEERWVGLATRVI